MAKNFMVSVLRKSATLQLKLMGDFDGTSAFDLLNVIGENCRGIESVFIHTNGLKDIYPFGLDIFFNHLHTLRGKPIRLVFTGEKAAEFSAKGSGIFDRLESISNLGSK